MKRKEPNPSKNPTTSISLTYLSSLNQFISNSKILWIYITLVFVLTGIVSYYSYQNYQLKHQITVQQPTPSASLIENWSTYSSSKSMFSFKYPSDFVGKKKNLKGISISLGNDEFLLDLYINYNKEYYASMIEHVKKQVASNDLTANTKNFESFTAYLDSVQTAGGEHSFSRTVIISAHDDLIVFILSPKDVSKSTETEQLADQILSTFQFTN